MFCIVSANSNLEVVTWGPFDTLKLAKKAKRRVEQIYPKPQHIICELHTLEEANAFIQGSSNEETEEEKG